MFQGKTGNSYFSLLNLLFCFVIYWKKFNVSQAPCMIHHKFFKTDYRILSTYFLQDVTSTKAYLLVLYMHSYLKSTSLFTEPRCFRFFLFLSLQLFLNCSKYQRCKFVKKFQSLLMFYYIIKLSKSLYFVSIMHKYF